MQEYVVRDAEINSFIFPSSSSSHCNPLALKWCMDEPTDSHRARIRFPIPQVIGLYRQITSNFKYRGEKIALFLH